MSTCPVSLNNKFLYSPGLRLLGMGLIGTLLSLSSGCSQQTTDLTYHEMSEEEAAVSMEEEHSATQPAPSSKKSQSVKSDQLAVSENTEAPSKEKVATPGNRPAAQESEQPQSSPMPELAKASEVPPATKLAASATDPKSTASSDSSLPVKQSPAAMRAALLGKPSVENSAATTSLTPLVPKLLIPEKSFQVEGPENAVRVSFDDLDLLKVLNMEPVPEDAPNMFPDWLQNLDGRRVRIRGFMFPTLSQTGITYFQHVRDNEICCFGRTPKIYDRISTVLRNGKSTHYIQGRPFDVVGTLRIDPIYEDGEWLQLYLLEDAIVME